MSNDLRIKIISRAFQRLIGQLDLEDLTALYKAKQNAWHASAHLGINSQIATQECSQTVMREIIAGLSDYKIDRMEQELKVSARELAKYTAEEVTS